MYVCMYVCTYVFMYVCMYVCMLVVLLKLLLSDTGLIVNTTHSKVQQKFLNVKQSLKVLNDRKVQSLKCSFSRTVLIYIFSTVFKILTVPSNAAF